MVAAYRALALSRVPPPASPIRIATTAMHGVGGALLAALLAEAGHAQVHPVAAQEAPDPDFPTVPFPNPEEPGATGLLGRARCATVEADLGLALDPDADRVAVMVPDRDGGPRQLTGDDVGALLGDWLLGAVTSGPGRLVVSSVVSSSLLARIAEARGARHAETLTGFKWLSRPAMEHPELVQVLAYEEALGYAIGPEVRDKDGLSAAVAVASMAAAAPLTGAHPARRARRPAPPPRSARDRQLLAARRGPRRRRAARRPGGASGGRAPGARSAASGRRACAAWRPTCCGSTSRTGSGWWCGPSGTEPKLKCYCEAVEAVERGPGGRARGARAGAPREGPRGPRRPAARLTRIAARAKIGGCSPSAVTRGAPS